MSKKKSGSFFGSILALAAIVLGVVAVLLFALLPMMKLTINLGDLGSSEATIGGFGMIFGGTATVASGDNSEALEGLAANTMAIVAFIVAVLGIVALVVGLLMKNKIAKGVGGLVLAVGGVLMFCVLDSSLTAIFAGVGGMKPGDFGYDTALAAFKEIANPSLGIGAIIGGVAGILGGAAGVGGALLK